MQGIKKGGNMSKYRTFEVNDKGDKVHGEICIRLDDEDKTIFQKLRSIGFNINRQRNKLIWWDDDYVEIINKKSELTIGYMERSYA